MKNNRISMLLATVFSCAFLSTYAAWEHTKAALAQQKKQAQPWSATKSALQSQGISTKHPQKQDAIRSIKTYEYPPIGKMKNPCDLLHKKLTTIVPMVISDMSDNLNKISKKTIFHTRMVHGNSVSKRGFSDELSFFANQIIQHQLFNLLIVAKQCNADEAKNCTIQRKQFLRRPTEITLKEEFFRIFTDSVGYSLHTYAQRMLVLASSWNKFLGLLGGKSRIEQLDRERNENLLKYFTTLFDANNNIFEATHELVKQLNPTIINKNFTLTNYKYPTTIYVGNFYKNTYFFEAMHMLYDACIYYKRIIETVKKHIPTK